MTEQEWNRIVEKAFSPDAPEPKFSDRYRRRRLALERMVTMKRERKSRGAGFWMVAAACCLVAVSPVVLYHIGQQNSITAPSQESKIAPGQAVEVPAPEEEGVQFPDEAVAEDADIAADAGEVLLDGISAANGEQYQIGFAWLPEGMYLHDSGPWELKIHSDDPDDSRIITPRLIEIPEGQDIEQIAMLCEALPMQGSGTQENGQHFCINYLPTDGVDFADGDTCIVFMDFGDDIPYGAELYITGLTKDEIENLLNGIYLTEVDESPALSAEADEAEQIHDEAEQDVNALAAEIDAYYDKYNLLENLREVQIGEPTAYSLYEADEYSNIQVTVDCITLQKNFDGITTDEIGRPADFSQYVDEQGQINVTRRAYREDGELVSEEVLIPYVIVTELTFTNTGTEAIEDVNYNNFLYFVKDGRIQHPDSFTELASDNNMFSIRADAELHKNNIARMEPGESVHVTCANILPAEYLEHFVIVLNEIASNSDELLTRPYVDLSYDADALVASEDIRD